MSVALYLQQLGYFVANVDLNYSYLLPLMQVALIWKEIWNSRVLMVIWQVGEDWIGERELLEKYDLRGILVDF